MVIITYKQKSLKSFSFLKYKSRISLILSNFVKIDDKDVISKILLSEN